MPKPWRNNWKKPKFAEFSHVFPVFSNFKLSVIITEDAQRTARYLCDRDYLRDFDIPEETEATTVTSVASGYSIIYLKPDAALGTIAHEAYHAVTGMLKMIGAAEEHEIVAYHLGYIVNKIVEFNLKVAPRFKKGKTK